MIMRRITTGLVLSLLFGVAPIPAQAAGFGSGEGDVAQHAQTDTLLAFDVRDAIPGFLKRSVETGDPQLGFLEVANISSSAAIISWVSKTSCIGWVEYGPTSELGLAAKETSATNVHFLWLTDLPAGQEIFFRVHSGEVDDKSLSDEPGSKIHSFETGQVAAGIPGTVYGVLPQIPDHAERSGTSVLVKLCLSGHGRRSLPLCVPASEDDIWLLNLGNLKTEDGQPFAYDDGMTAEIRIEGIGADGMPQILHSYKVRLSDAPNGDLSPPGALDIQRASKAVSPWDHADTVLKRGLDTASRDRGPTPERQFLESLLSKGADTRRESLRGHGRPHIIPGWRGGAKMGTSRPPEPDPPPSRLRLRGDVVLRELVDLRNQRGDARDFFPDVARHFPSGVREKLSRDTRPVSLYQGLNIVALPVDPTTPVTSFSFLTDVLSAYEVTAWDGTLQQHGPSAVRIGEEIQGTDFAFELGYGYFVALSTDDVVEFTGDPLISTHYGVVPAGLEVVSLVGNPDSVTSYTIFDGLCPNGSEICRLNPETQGYECAFQSGPGVLGEEFPIEEGVGYFIRNTAAQSFPEDHTAPSLTIVTPEDNDEIHTRQPYIDIIFGDHQIGLDAGTFACLINGEDKTSFFTVDDLGAIWQMDGGEELVEGTNVIDVTVLDLVGNQGNGVSTFDVVTLPPPEDEHFVNGHVFYGDTWEPIQGAAVTVGSIPGVIYTDVEGHYVFPTPGLGEYRIDIVKEHFTYAQRHLLIEDGWGDMFVDDAYLSPQDSVVTRITPEGGVAVNSHASIFTSFPPEAVEEDIDAVTTQFDEAEDLPKPLPPLSVFTYCADFGPDGGLSDTAFVDY
ncbi:hypothetical protein ACFL6M_06075, partial [Candidatus Eisenbacteria bacterium]